MLTIPFACGIILIGIILGLTAIPTRLENRALKIRLEKIKRNQELCMKGSRRGTNIYKHRNARRR